MDPYIRAYVQVHVHIDAGQRVWCKNVQLEVIQNGSTKKVCLPTGKILYTFDELKKMGARVDVVTLRSLAKDGAEGRWRENIKERRENGLPSNVYVANARTVQRAIDRGQPPPDVKYVGRMRDKITEVYDTVDQVVEAMGQDNWRKEFSRGRYAKRKPK